MKVKEKLVLDKLRPKLHQITSQRFPMIWNQMKISGLRFQLALIIVKIFLKNNFAQQQGTHPSIQAEWIKYD